MAAITGWGRGTWGQAEWGNPLPVEVTGVAGTSALGSETVVAEANVTLTGTITTLTVIQHNLNTQDNADNNT